MSARDIEFVELISLSYNVLGELLGRSGQAVRKGISNPKTKTDYFSPAEIVQLLAAAENEKPALADGLRAGACSIYPNLAPLITSASIRSPLANAISMGDSLYIVSPDFKGFESSYPHIFDEVVSACQSASAHLGLFVTKDEEEFCRTLMTGCYGSELKYNLYEMHSEASLSPTYFVHAPQRQIPKLYAVQDATLSELRSLEIPNIIRSLMAIRTEQDRSKAHPIPETSKRSSLSASPQATSERVSAD